VGAPLLFNASVGLALNRQDRVYRADVEVVTGSLHARC